MVHQLKVWPLYFKPLQSHKKNFELRKNDRNFKVGDTLLLKEFDPQTKKLTGKEVTRKIIYIASDLAIFGIPEDICILSIK